MKNDLKIADSVFVAQGAIVVGDVTIEENSSVWFNAVIRADNGPIRIGKNTNIQDNCVLHISEGGSMDIGDNVTVGHSAIVHGATVKSNTLIGMGSIILDDAVIGENCIVGANALVTSRTIIPDNSLVLGSPAKVVKQLTQEQIDSIAYSAQEYIETAKRFMEE